MNNLGLVLIVSFDYRDMGSDTIDPEVMTVRNAMAERYARRGIPVVCISFGPSAILNLEHFTRLISNKGVVNQNFESEASQEFRTILDHLRGTIVHGVGNPRFMSFAQQGWSRCCVIFVAHGAGLETSINGLHYACFASTIIRTLGCFRVYVSDVMVMQCVFAAFAPKSHQDRCAHFLMTLNQTYPVFSRDAWPTRACIPQITAWKSYISTKGPDLRPTYRQRVAQQAGQMFSRIMGRPTPPSLPRHLQRDGLDQARNIPQAKRRVGIHTRQGPGGGTQYRVAELTDPVDSDSDREDDRGRPVYVPSPQGPRIEPRMFHDPICRFWAGEGVRPDQMTVALEFRPGIYEQLSAEHERAYPVAVQMAAQAPVPPGGVGAPEQPPEDSWISSLTGWLVTG